MRPAGEGRGIPIVLTADRLLMAEYPTLLDGMLAGGLTTATPEAVMRLVVSRPVSTSGVRACVAPLGVRLVEAALLRDGFTGEDVAVVPPGLLGRAIGPATRAVLVSSGDPLGLGMNDSTMCGIDGGEPWTKVWFGRLCRRIARTKPVCPGLRVIVGGPGAWQLAERPEERARLGIDCLFLGYAERDLPRLVRDILEGRDPPALREARRTRVDDIPPVCGPTSMGVVETSRGCGLGCPFCTLSSEPMFHMPAEKVVRDVETNVGGGVPSVALISEDFLRYGSKGGELAPDAVLSLARAVRSVPGLGIVQLDHVNVSSAARFPPERLRELRDVLTMGTRHRLLWVNLGVETASGALLERSRCGGKLRPFGAGGWEAACEAAVANLLDAGFTPMLSLILGLAGETEDDLRRTLGLLERLARLAGGRPLLAFPLFHAPLAGGGRGFGAGDMTPLHWRLFGASYELNFRWMPPLYWDNHIAAGVGLPRRLAVRLGGIAKTLQWRIALAARQDGGRRMED